MTDKKCFMITGYGKTEKEPRIKLEDRFKDSDRYLHAYSKRQATLLFAKRFSKLLNMKVKLIQCRIREVVKEDKVDYEQLKLFG